MKFCGIVIVVC